MEDKKGSNELEEEPYYQKIIKKTKTGITFPKELRDDLFEEEEDVYFNLIVPKNKEKIILNVISEKEIEEHEEKKSSEKSSSSKSKKTQKKGVPEPIWTEYFIYDFKNQEKIKSILESAYYKFAEDPEQFDDAIGRVKYALVSFLTSVKTENAKLYFSVIKFLADVIKKFDYPKLINWIYEKVVPNVESKFLYELSLMELIELSVKYEEYKQAETYVSDILTHLDQYSEGEKYNIMNTLTQLIRTVKDLEKKGNIHNIIKEKLIEFEKKISNVDNKIQLIEFLENLRFIEEAYHLTDNLSKELPSEDHRINEVRKMKKRLKETPI